MTIGTLWLSLYITLVVNHFQAPQVELARSSLGYKDTHGLVITALGLQVYYLHLILYYASTAMVWL